MWKSNMNFSEINISMTPSANVLLFIFLNINHINSTSSPFIFSFHPHPRPTCSCSLPVTVRPALRFQNKRQKVATYLIFHLQLLSPISPTPPAPAWTGLLHCFAEDENRSNQILFTFRFSDPL